METIVAKPVRIYWQSISTLCFLAPVYDQRVCCPWRLHLSLSNVVRVARWCDEALATRHQWPFSLRAQFAFRSSQWDGTGNVYIDLGTSYRYSHLKAIEPCVRMPCESAVCAMVTVSRDRVHNAYKQNPARLYDFFRALHIGEIIFQ